MKRVDKGMRGRRSDFRFNYEIQSTVTGLGNYKLADSLRMKYLRVDSDLYRRAHLISQLIILGVFGGFMLLESAFLCLMSAREFPLHPLFKLIILFGSIAFNIFGYARFFEKLAKFEYFNWVWKIVKYIQFRRNV